MNDWDTLTFSGLGSCPPANLPIAEGSKSMLGIPKLGFIQLDGLKTGEWGWCVGGVLAHTSQAYDDWCAGDCWFTLTVFFLLCHLVKAYMEVVGDTKIPV